ncbi:MAG: beta-lactamase family protein [Saprospiraceae bacterium]|nr:beta-lactamase family protein [Saprospiraceae bacterium]
MIKFYTVIVIFFLTGNICAQADNLKNEINKIIEYDTDINFEKTPGFIVAVVDGDSTFYTSFGHRSRDEPESIERNHLFEIGSTSKVFTSLLIFKYLEEGQFSIKDKVNDLLPQDYINPRLEQLTLYDLINHISGFPRIPEFFGKKQKNTLDPYAYFSKEDLLLYYRDYVPRRNNDKFNYSHVNYALLEIILEEYSGMTFHDLMKQQIFDPLDMKNSFVDFSEDRSITPGYNRAMRKVKPWSFASFSASEGIKSTAEDLSNFVRLNLGLKYPTLYNSVESQLQIVEKTNYNDKIMMANGWHVVDQGKKYNIYTHTGKTSGHTSFLAFVKETKTGVVILSNSSWGVEDLGFLILRMINYNWNRKV